MFCPLRTFCCVCLGQEVNKLVGRRSGNIDMNQSTSNLSLLLALHNPFVNAWTTSHQKIKQAKQMISLNTVGNSSASCVFKVWLKNQEHSQCWIHIKFCIIICEIFIFRNFFVLNLLLVSDSCGSCVSKVGRDKCKCCHFYPFLIVCFVFQIKSQYWI